MTCRGSQSVSVTQLGIVALCLGNLLLSSEIRVTHAKHTYSFRFESLIWFTSRFSISPAHRSHRCSFFAPNRTESGTSAVLYQTLNSSTCSTWQVGVLQGMDVYGGLGTWSRWHFIISLTEWFKLPLQITHQDHTVFVWRLHYFEWSWMWNEFLLSWLQNCFLWVLIPQLLLVCDAGVLCCYPVLIFLS